MHLRLHGVLVVAVVVLSDLHHASQSSPFLLHSPCVFQKSQLFCTVYQQMNTQPSDRMTASAPRPNSTPLRRPGMPKGLAKRAYRIREAPDSRSRATAATAGTKPLVDMDDFGGAGVDDAGQAPGRREVAAVTDAQPAGRNIQAPAECLAGAPCVANLRHLGPRT